MSQHLDNMAIGDKIDFRGPSGLLVYNGNSRLGAAVVTRCHCGTAIKRKDNLPSPLSSSSSSSSSFRNRSLCHPSRQEVGGESSQVQTRCNDCWRNRFGFSFLTRLWFVTLCIVCRQHLAKGPQMCFFYDAITNFFTV